MSRLPVVLRSQAFPETAWCKPLWTVAAGEEAWVPAEALRALAGSGSDLDPDAPAYSRARRRRAVRVRRLERDGIDGFDVVVPTSLRYRWSQPPEGYGPVTPGLRVHRVIDEPVLLGRVVRKLTSRSWVAAQIDDWWNERTRAPGEVINWVLLGLAGAAGWMVALPKLAIGGLLLVINNITEGNSIIQAIRQRRVDRWARAALSLRSGEVIDPDTGLPTLHAPEAPEPPQPPWRRWRSRHRSAGPSAPPAVSTTELLGVGAGRSGGVPAAGPPAAELAGRRPLKLEAPMSAPGHRGTQPAGSNTLAGVGRATSVTIGGARVRIASRDLGA